jgi:putative salt-induced outer membrane protein YdiY
MNPNKITSLLAAVVLTGFGAGSTLAQPASVTAPPPPQWVSSAALGVTLTRGNSDTTMVSADARTEDKWDANDLTLGANGLYGDQKTLGASKSTETADLLHGFAQYNRIFAADKLYGFLRVDGLHDGIADIQYRLTTSPGLGYYVVKEKNTEVGVEVGPGWIDEKLGHEYKNFAVLRLAETIRQTISDRARAWEMLEYLAQMDKLDDYIMNAEIGIEADLTKKKNLSLRVTLDDSYNNDPAAGRLKNDLKLITALAYKF